MRTGVARVAAIAPLCGRLLRRFLAAQVLVAALGLASPSEADARPAATAEEIQAAYLHKFTGFIDWPPKSFTTAAAPIVVGVVGSDRMHALLLDVAGGKAVQGRTVEVRRLTTPAQSAGTHLVFVGQGAWDALPAWSAAAHEHAVVVATDAPRGVERGAALAFVQAGRRVRFEASVAAAERAGVRLSARLLAVAEKVVGKAE